MNSVFGSKAEKDLKHYSPRVDEINAVYETLHSVSNDELRNKTLEFRERIKEYLSEIDADIADLRVRAEETGDIREKEEFFNEIDSLQNDRDEKLEEILYQILPEAFAVVKETARRFKENDIMEVTATDFDREQAIKVVKKGKSYIKIDGDKAIYNTSWKAAGADIEWNMLHYDVQLIGGMVLHDGKIAEMATGEGKTLVATLPAYLNGLSGQGVHVVTVNDYLARRDSEWIGPIFEFLFLTVDCIDNYKPHSQERRDAYNCDITYGTNNEFGFDYLRDNMVRSKEEQVQGKHHYCMIDEVDSVLIDDARTPLIISGPIAHDDTEQEYAELKPRVEKLLRIQRNVAAKYLNDAKKLIADGITGVEEDEGGMALLRAHRALPKSRPLIKYLSEEGVKQILLKTENHYMQEQSKNMHLVDAELYFTIDEKNRIVELTEKGAEYLAEGENDPNFFVMPDLGSKMQELEDNKELPDEERRERRNDLITEFTVKSQRLHSINQLLKAYTLFEKDEEYVVLDNEVKIVDEQTGRMMEGRRYSDGLHQALEAKEGVEIGDITQTYATVTLQNYFRMYHKLAGMTGTAETEAGEFWEIYELDVVVIPTNRPIIRDDRDDLIYKTAKEKFNAVIEEIGTLTSEGRPVLVGTTSVEISELLSRMLSIRGIQHNILNAKHHQREAEIVAEAGKPGAVTIATNMAGRGTDIKLGDGVKESGGLAIIATERHDSRRVDRQLRGRAGRQGDPGSSQFFVSLEDKLMRLLNSQRIARVMDMMGHKEGDVIQHKRITKTLENAQQKVEENNFGVRKRLLEYDDVMNIQREAIYKKRENALKGERLAVDLDSMFRGFIENIIYVYKQMNDFGELKFEMVRLIGMEPPFDESQFKTLSAEDLILQMQEKVFTRYREKSEQIGHLLLPLVTRVYKEQGHKYKRILIPFEQPGKENNFSIAAELEDAVQSEGRSIMKDIEKTVTLSIIDNEWKDHLREMDELKDSSQAASFEQKDPLVVYKMEAFNLFEQLIMRINTEVTSYLLKGKLNITDSPDQIQQAEQQKTDFSRIEESRESEEQRMQRKAAENAGYQTQQVETVVREEPKVGRNDPCPCGSGKKFKHCHGR